MKYELKPGDPVEFVGRGVKMRGTFIRYKTKTQRKLQKMLAMRNIHDLPTTHVMEEISVIGSGIWTILAGGAKKIEGANVPKATDGLKYAQGIRQSKIERKNKIQSSNFQKTDANGLNTLKAGDPVWVAYKERYGYQVVQETFLQTTSMGKTRIRTRWGRERIIGSQQCFADERMARQYRGNS